MNCENNLALTNKVNISKEAGHISKDINLKYIGEFIWTSSGRCMFYELYLQYETTKLDKITVFYGTRIGGIKILDANQFCPEVNKSIINYIKCHLIEQIFQASEYRSTLSDQSISIIKEYIGITNIVLENNDSLKWYGPNAAKDKFPNLNGLILASLGLSFSAPNISPGIRYYIAIFKCLKNYLDDGIIYERNSFILIVLGKNFYTNYLYLYQIFKLNSDESHTDCWNIISLKWLLIDNSWIDFIKIKVNDQVLIDRPDLSPRTIIKLFSGV